MSKYFSAIKNNDVHLFENNYILRKEDKKVFMERTDIGFSIYIYTGPELYEERIVKGGSTQNEYNGQISRFTDFNEISLLKNNSR
jgi:pantothenate kinase